jgi:hypothetical protein
MLNLFGLPCLFYKITGLSFSCFSITSPEMRSYLDWALHTLKMDRGSSK